jgi:1-acyl-sn-glycerol-3-phosphate acyltransferase
MQRLPNRPFLAVGNHSGGLLIPDTLVWLAAYHTRNLAPPMLSLAHDAMFRHYPARLTRSLARMGAVRADRELARRALQRGYCVSVYPGGDRDACRSWSRRNEIVFAGRRGYVELAIEAGVPIVPVASIGGHEALVTLWDGAALARRIPWCRRNRITNLPVSLSLPWGLWIGPQPGYLPLPTKIRTRVLDPIDPIDYASSSHGKTRDARPARIRAIDHEVRMVLQGALDEMASERRWPVLG